MSDPTALALRQGGTIGHLLVRAFQRRGDAEMLVGDGERLSYAQMADRTARMLSVLQALGLQTGSSLALLSRNRIDVLSASYAAYIAGLRLTPLSAMTSDDDLAFMLEDAAIDALLVDDTLFGTRCQALRARVPGLKHLLSLGPLAGAFDVMAAAAVASPAPLRVRARPDDIAVIGYTGGTTGRPKGVVHTHASLLAAVTMMAAEWEWPDDLRMLAATPVSHAAGVMALPVALLGGSFHMLAGFDAGSLLSYVELERISVTFLVPVMIYRMIDAARAQPRDLTSLKTIFYGAAPMLPARLVEGLQVFGPVFMQLYGQSEAPTCIAWLGRRQHDQQHPQRLASCGVPFADIDVALFDEQLQPVSDGDVGEICVRGPHVMAGYWQRPAETAAALAGGWLHTGDMGRFDADGFLYIVDRKKDMIISGGFNVYPREVEDVIGALPGVAMVAVVGVADERWGEAVTALVVPQPGAVIDEDAVIAAVREKKGAMQAPKSVRVVERLPLTPLGKVDKKSLRAQLP
ncbi:MAG: AMP-binding protein [Burkholderiales bacterium]